MELEAVIGLEIHVQISTKTKMFCRCDNDSFDKEANINTCPMCMGFPGQLPVINKDAVEKGIKAALALNCKINSFSKFDRKNYFYPDSPKGFQISQFDEPISEKGLVKVRYYDEKGDQDEEFDVGITRLHLEDDAGKLTHMKDGSLVDFNRAGTPLMEIVSDPDLRSARQAAEYAKEIQRIVRYVGSSEADMEKGMMRFDASVSIRPKGEDKLYARAEIKNLNSFKALENAVKYEISRQKGLWEKGEKLEKMITMGWSDDKGKTYFMREKEESDDYRYFPEPDIPPLTIDAETVDQYRSEIPELPYKKKQRYVQEMGLNEDDARILSQDLKMALYFEDVVSKTENAKAAVSFINTVLMKYLKEELIDIDQQKVSSEMMAELIKLVDSGEISNNVAKTEIFEEMYKTGESPKVIVDKKGLKQVSDTGEIEKIAKQIIDANPDTVADIKAGKDRAVGFLIGQVMKEMKGQANPQVVSEIMAKLLK